MKREIVHLKFTLLVYKGYILITVELHVDLLDQSQSDHCTLFRAKRDFLLYIGKLRIKYNRKSLKMQKSKLVAKPSLFFELILVIF